MNERWTTKQKLSVKNLRTTGTIQTYANIECKCNGKVWKWGGSINEKRKTKKKHSKIRKKQENTHKDHLHCLALYLTRK